MNAKKSSGPISARRRILILDDHPLTRCGMVQLIQREPNLEVCGEADNAHRALAAVNENEPDLVICDLSLPGRNGLEFLKDMRAMHPKVPVLVVSMHDESLYAERALKAGARGYVMKHTGGAEFIQAIRRVLEGRVYLSTAMAEKAVDVLSGRRSTVTDSIVAQLTDRELEVFQCLGQGMTSREIGSHLHMSVKTVETHRRHIREKLKLRTGPELIKFAVRWAGAEPSL